MLSENTAVSTRHRNQFVLGPTIPAGYETWPRATIGPTLTLAVHPSMDLTRRGENGRCATCIGYMLDPTRPQASDAGILDGLLAAPTREALFDRLSGLGGRWVLIYEDGPDVILINDTLGHRQVYFTDDRHAGPIWCASRPRALADLLQLEPDPAAAAYLDHIIRHNPADVLLQRDHWWPGIGSPYPGVRHLTPNCYLDLNTKEQRRFWPVAPVVERSLDDAADEGAAILTGMILAAHERFDAMTLMITSGLDSRLVLAACRPVARRLGYVTLDYPKGDPVDVALPARLLPRLGLQHDIARAGLGVDGDFLDIYRANVIMPNDFYAANAEALAPFFRRRRLALNGVATGVFTGHYRLPGPAGRLIRQVTPELLVDLLREHKNHPFAVRAFAEWFDTLGDIHNHHLLDLFF